MKRSESQTTLRALDRLDAEESRDLDSQLGDDPALAAEVRETEDAIAAVWQASAPLQQAPIGSYEEIRKKIHPASRRKFIPIVVAVGGWAAAVALFLNPRDQSPVKDVGSQVEVVPQLASRGTQRGQPLQPPQLISRRDLGQNEIHLRETIRSLEANLRRSLSGPRIRELRPPGDPSHTNPEQRAEALLGLLKAALTDSIAREVESPASLVIEEGWLESVFANLPKDGVIRHRGFPAKEFYDFGLLRSPEGDFYHPATQILWTPASDGGGYLGEAAPPETDLTLFEEGEPPAESRFQPNYQLVEAPTTGYVVFGEAGADATIIVGNLETGEELPTLMASNGGESVAMPLSVSGIWDGADDSTFATFSIPANLVTDSTSGGAITIFTSNADGSLTPILTESP